MLKEAETRKAELVTEIADKEDDLAELDSQLEDVRMDIAGEEDRLSAFGKERTGLRETLQSFAPSLPMFGAGKLRGKLSAAQSSIGSALCDGLASRIREDIAGIWLKVEELRSRISRQLEYLMPKPKTESYGLDEVMRDATRAAERWNRDHAAPQGSRSRGQSR